MNDLAIEIHLVLLEISWAGAEGFELGPEVDPFGLPDFLRRWRVVSAAIGARRGDARS